MWTDGSIEAKSEIKSNNEKIKNEMDKLELNNNSDIIQYESIKLQKRAINPKKNKESDIESKDDENIYVNEASPKKKLYNKRTITPIKTTIYDSNNEYHGVNRIEELENVMENIKTEDRTHKENKNVKKASKNKIIFTVEGDIGFLHSSIWELIDISSSFIFPKITLLRPFFLYNFFKIINKLVGLIE